jgi:hypothetical protein
MSPSLTIIFFNFVSVFTVFIVISAVLQDKIRRIAISTHIIVNNERSVMLRTIANLAELVAKSVPEDVSAQKYAENAKLEADKASKG